MAKTRTRARTRGDEPIVETVTTDWAVAMFPLSGRWAYALVRLFGVEGDAPTGKRLTNVKQLTVTLMEVLRVNDDGGVDLTQHTTTDIRWLTPSNTKTTAAEYMKYLRERYSKAGGNELAKAMFGVRPVRGIEPSQRSMTLERLYWDTAKRVEMSVEELTTKFGHMNAGMQAMKLRALVRNAKVA